MPSGFLLCADGFVHRAGQAPNCDCRETKNGRTLATASLLLTKTELRDERLIAGGIDFLEIVKQLAARVDHRQQTTA